MSATGNNKPSATKPGGDADVLMSLLEGAVSKLSITEVKTNEKPSQETLRAIRKIEDALGITRGHMETILKQLYEFSYLKKEETREMLWKKALTAQGRIGSYKAMKEEGNLQDLDSVVVEGLTAELTLLGSMEKNLLDRLVELKDTRREQEGQEYREKVRKRFEDARNK